MVNTQPVVIGLCSGIGMLETAVHLVFPRARTAALCEWEAYAATAILARMEEKSLEPAPIWCGDLGGFDAKPFLGLVHILCAGLPCQPYSLAGKRKGNTDHRSHGEDGTSGPVPQALRIISECQPALVFFENVPAWVRGGHFQTVGEELSRLGYAIQEPLFLTAQSVGASHKRERVFILALSPHARTAVDWGAAMAHPAGDGPGERPPAAPQRGSSNSGSVVSRELPRGSQGFRDDLADSSIARGGGVHARRGGCGEEAGHPDGTSPVVGNPERAERRPNHQHIEPEVGRIEGAGGSGRSGGELADTARGRRPDGSSIGRVGGEVEPAGEGGERIGDCSPSVAHSEHGERRQDRDSRQHEVGAPVTRGGSELADTRCGGRSGSESESGCCGGKARCKGSQQADGASECRCKTANTERAGLQEWGGQPGYDGEERAAAERCCNTLGAPSLFAPGPADTRWGEVLEVYPYLAPAIVAGSVRVYWNSETESLESETAESSVRCLADGDALVLDAMRTDQLRVTGNSVVAICGATALALLVKRAGLLEPR